MTQLAVLSGIALLAALALSGLNYPITRLFEGYPLERTRDWRLLGLAHRWLVGMQQRRYDQLLNRRDADNADRRVRNRAAWEFDRAFPARRDSVLPTRFGNAVRAFEGHARSRYGLDGIAIWPRIEVLLPATERELHTDARIDVNAFLNAALAAVLVGVVLAVDLVRNTPISAGLRWLYAIPFVTGYLLYRATVGAAIRWGSEVRASVDLHRLELYGPAPRHTRPGSAGQPRPRQHGGSAVGCAELASDGQLRLCPSAAQTSSTRRCCSAASSAATQASRLRSYPGTLRCPVVS